MRKLSEHTTRAYRLDLNRFTRFAGLRTNVASCDRSTLQRYVEHLFNDHQLKETSAKRHLASLRSLFRFLEDEGHVSEDPFRGARFRIRLPKRLPRILTGGELLALLDRSSSTDDFAELTTCVAAELLFATGIRVAELAALRDQDVDLSTGVINIIGKGDRQRRVYVPDSEVRDLLEIYRSVRTKRGSVGDFFLVNSRGEPASPQFIRRLIRRLGEAVALSRRVTPHMFRHSVATYLLEEGVDIRFVQWLLGHRSIATTEIYNHVADAALRSRVVERHPRKTILRRS